MTTMNRWCLGALAALLLTGCSTTTITNLTPTRLPRKDSGQYAFSVEYATRQSTILRDTFKAYVIVGDERIPMEPTPHLTNRYETLVSVPPGKEVLTYRYRFEYDYKAIPDRRAAVRDSKYYQLYLQGQ